MSAYNDEEDDSENLGDEDKLELSDEEDDFEKENPIVIEVKELNGNDRLSQKHATIYDVTDIITDIALRLSRGQKFPHESKEIDTFKLAREIYFNVSPQDLDLGVLRLHGNGSYDKILLGEFETFPDNWKPKWFKR